MEKKIGDVPPGASPTAIPERDAPQGRHLALRSLCTASQWKGFVAIDVVGALWVPFNLTSAHQIGSNK